MRRNLPLLIVAVAVVATVYAYYELASYRTPDVPFVTTPPDIVEAMLDLAKVDDTDVVYDLGCGDGRLAIGAAQRGARAVGIDIDPQRIREARDNAERQDVQRLVSFRRADIFTLDLRPASVILFYLQVSVNARLIPQFERLPAGVRIVSHQFSIPGLEPKKRIEVRSREDGLDHPLYLWVTPLEKAEGGGGKTGPRGE